MPAWVQHPTTGKFIPKELYDREDVNAPYVQGDVKDFISPITKEMITDRGQLRRHMQQYGVTRSEDYSEDFLKKRSKARDDKMTGNTPQAKAERREALNRALEKGGY